MKKDHIEIPSPSSTFNKVSCKECGEEQVVYSHATTAVICNSCGNAITTPGGSKAEIHGTISGSAE